MSTALISRATDRQFPPEVVQLIVDASLAPYDPFCPSPRRASTFRYKILKSYCRINSTWRGVSEPSLLKWVVIASEWHVEKYLRLIEERGGAMDEVEDLFLGFPAPVDSIVARVLRSVRNVKNLNLQFATVDLADLVRLHELRRLRFFFVKFANSPSATSIVLPQLQFLTIANLGKLPPQLLTPSCLPRLLYFDYPDSMETRFDALLPQLHATTLGSTTIPPFSLCTSLRILHFPQAGFFRVEHLSSLTSLPPFLSIDYESHGVEMSQHEIGSALQKIRSALENLITTKQSGLRVVLLRGWEIDDSIKELAKRLESKGIRVEMIKAPLSFSRAIERMEEIVAEEAKAAEAKEIWD